MASGNSLAWIGPRAVMQPATLYALHDIIVGTSTPAEAIPVLVFDASTTWYADFRCKMPQNYAGGGITVVICSAAAVTAGGVTWEIALRAIEDDTEDLDTTAHTYDYNSLDVAALASVVGEVTYDNLTFTDGADMDSAGAGDEFILRIRRNVADSNDTAAGFAYLVGLEVKET